MASLVHETPVKRQKLATQETNENDNRVIIQFKDSESEPTGSNLEVPLSLGIKQLEELLNEIKDEDDYQPFSFTISDTAGKNVAEVTTTLQDAYKSVNISSERVLCVNYYPLSKFKVIPVTRCTATLSGHTEAILACAFSPDSTQLATASGDTTVRLWDLHTETPYKTGKGHTSWVLCVCWSPDGKFLASAGMDSTIRVWNATTGSDYHDRPLKGHTKAVSCLCWQPLHLVDPNAENAVPKLVSGSKDNSIRIWDVVLGVCIQTLNSHTKHITQICWSGEPNNVIYSAARDTLVKVWNVDKGTLVCDLKQHAHWVNSLALNTGYVMRSGAFGHTNDTDIKSHADSIKAAKARYDECMKVCGKERLLSGSDDFTMFLWAPLESKKPIARMTGHQKLVNDVKFSPDGRYFASASFDKSIRLWDGRTGRYIAAFRGHVGSVYMICWSFDSRMIVSSSADSTVKVWDVAKKKLKEDLPGHADEVYALDWSCDGTRVASGSKDCSLKIWRN